MMALPAAFFSGCSVGQVVPPFSPKEVNPEPYYPEAVWSANTDPTLLALQALKRLTGETMPPGSGTKAAAAAASTAAAGTAAAGTTSGTTPGGVTPVPGPAPGPAPAPAGRVPSTGDPIFGYVYDQIEGGVIPGATVSLYDKRGALIDAIVTNSAGMYSFSTATISSGSSYRVVASATGYSAVPLSEFQFIYPIVTLPINLYLAYVNPFQELPGGSYTSLGFTATDTVNNVPVIFRNNYNDCGFYGDVMPTDFYAASTQKTYNAVLYDYKGSIRDNTPSAGFTAYSQGWAEYTFYLPDPLTNHYSYDGLWITLPESYVVANGVWTVGGTGTVLFYDWEAVGWGIVGSTLTTGFVQPPFWAVKPTTEADPAEGRAGQVNVIVLSDQDVISPLGPYVLTKIKLSYDYHKDTTAPTVSSSYYDRLSNTFIIQVQENAYMVLDYVKKSDSTAGHVIMPVEADQINSCQPSYTGIVLDEVLGGSTYTIFLQDQAGNSSPQTYSYTAP